MFLILKYSNYNIIYIIYYPRKKKNKLYKLMLFLLNEIFTNGFSHSLLNIISVAAVLCGIFVIISKNPIVSVLFLIGLFLNIAGYLTMLGINFIGLSYLLVYVGAVSILFLFILMLINVRISELVTDNNNSIPLAIIIGIIFYVTFYELLPYTSITINTKHGLSVKSFTLFKQTNEKIFDNLMSLNYTLSNFFNYSETYMVSSQVWDGFLSETSHITSIGNVIYTVYPIWLILTSVILLLAMVGAIIITVKQK